MDYISWINANIIWGVPMLILMLGTGLYLIMATRGMLFRKFPVVIENTLKTIFVRKSTANDGTISPFQAVCTALAATVGTGNIVGIAVAINTGGPGAIFWMWVAAFFGMSTKFAETTLAVAYRRKDRGEVSGGPMFYMERGLGWKKGAFWFCLFTVIASFGVGNMVQANAVAGGLKSSFQIPNSVTGFVLSLAVGLVIIGGIKRISSFAEKVVPLMAGIYIISAIVVLLFNFQKIPQALLLILECAFQDTAPIGGFAGAGVMYAARIGVSRGVFTNEAGLGSAPIAHAGANVDHPARQGCWGAFEVFFDTIVMCTITALVIITSGVWTTGIEPSDMAFAAFEMAIPYGRLIVSLGIVMFAFASIIAWYYYAEKAIEYIAGKKIVLIFRVIFAGVVFWGCVAKVETVWQLADLFNGLMAIPNLLALICLEPTIKNLTKDFFSSSNRKRKNGASYQYLMQLKEINKN